MRCLAISEDKPFKIEFQAKTGLEKGDVCEGMYVSQPDKTLLQHFYESEPTEHLVIIDYTIHGKGINQEANSDPLSLPH